MTSRLNLDPRLGDAILTLIERQTGRRCHIALIACPVEPSGKLGQPDFVTSLQPKEMEDLIIQVGGGFALVGDPIVNRGAPQ